MPLPKQGKKKLSNRGNGEIKKKKKFNQLWQWHCQKQEKKKKEVTKPIKE